MVQVGDEKKEQSLIAWMQQHPGITFMVFILVIVLFNHLSKAYAIKNLEAYKPPAFDDLKVSSGTMILQPFERSSGRGPFITDGCSKSSCTTCTFRFLRSVRLALYPARSFISFYNL
jgi:hypothetical protein